MERNGVKVNSWTRGSLIGQGAFGKVNLALNMESGELFAVKSIEWCCKEAPKEEEVAEVVVEEEGGISMSAEMKAMENEVRILESLGNSSPFVVNCLGSSFSVEGGKSMRNVFMEYMPGGSVADLMRKFGGAGFEEQLVRKYARDILQGIHFLHSQGVVHCDIKGRNVLVGNDGVVKLADFGGARRLGSEGEVLAMVDGADLLLNVKGTPLWMAPEVVTQVEQGPASDIWSLGCTVVEMATGKAPWSDIVGTDPFVALYHIGCTEEVPDLPSCLSEQGRDFLRKCFQRDPRVRWTAHQLLHHPFITDSLLFSSTVVSHVDKPTAADIALQQFAASPTKPADTPLPSSPTSAFDFPSSSSSAATTIVMPSSTIGNSVPILRSPLQFFAKRFPLQQQQQQQQGGNFFQTEDAPVHKQSATTVTSSTTSSTCTDFWCDSPLSDFAGQQWITVRTPTKTHSRTPSFPSTPSSPSLFSSPSPSPSPSAARELSTIFRVIEEEEEAAAAAAAESASQVVVNKTEDSRAVIVASEVELCATEDNEEGHEEEQEGGENLDMATTTGEASSSGIADAQSTPCSIAEDDRSSRSRTRIESDNSEKGCSNRATAADDDDADKDRRCDDCRGRPKPNCASLLGDPQRKIDTGSAHGKLSFSFRVRRGSRPKPLRQRLVVCRQLHEDHSFHRRKRLRGSVGRSFEFFGETLSLLPIERTCNGDGGIIDGVGGAGGSSLQLPPPPFFRNRQQLQKKLLQRNAPRSADRSVLSQERVSQDSFLGGGLLSCAKKLPPSFFINRHGAKLQPPFFFTHRFCLIECASLVRGFAQLMGMYMNVGENFELPLFGLVLPYINMMGLFSLLVWRISCLRPSFFLQSLVLLKSDIVIFGILVSWVPHLKYLVFTFCLFLFLTRVERLPRSCPFICGIYQL